MDRSVRLAVLVLCGFYVDAAEACGGRRLLQQIDAQAAGYIYSRRPVFPAANSEIDDAQVHVAAATSFSVNKQQAAAAANNMIMHHHQHTSELQGTIISSIHEYSHEHQIKGSLSTSSEKWGAAAPSARVVMKKEGRLEEVLGMDYAQPRRNPPIHNTRRRP